MVVVPVVGGGGPHFDDGGKRIVCAGELKVLFNAITFLLSLKRVYLFVQAS